MNVFSPAITVKFDKFLKHCGTYAEIAKLYAAMALIKSRITFIKTLYSLRAAWAIGGFGWGLFITFFILVLMR